MSSPHPFIGEEIRDVRLPCQCKPVAWILSFRSADRTSLTMDFNTDFPLKWNFLSFIFAA